ncbi:hypothetical protein [Aquamicrobium sp.]|uniref:hypothetical protein n=1 Tax=Aquamicrobium sp. TaxID=1872579 RepID=UPI00258C64B6|nr:hypothetical protein [Aquamicrobium sp.]MCK9552665.1 hypothetical protein [Aquamicrobium sp.]
MPLQNRVDPFGAIHAVAERGMFTGNRGIIHDPDTRTLLPRRWTTKAWIICECDFGDRRRVPMGLNGARNGTGGEKAGWTELFFLDEVTALSAGHRPCFYCRRERAKDFLSRFATASGIAEPRAPQLDTRLHGERLASGTKPAVMTPADIAKLPDGAMFSNGATCFTRRDDRYLQWSFAGYIPAAIPEADGFVLLTPSTTVAVLRAGYRPDWHASAGA